MIQGSPDVFVQETDYTVYANVASSTRGAVVGDFAWGPVEDPLLLTDEASLVKYFGKPNDKNYKDWFTARNFLSYSGNLRLVRVCSEDSKNACDVPDSATLIKNPTIFEKMVGTLVEGEGSIFARYPGTEGNDLRVVIASKDILYPWKDAPTLQEDGDEEEEPGTPKEPETPKERGQNTTHVLFPYITRNMEDTDVAYGVFKGGVIQEFQICSMLQDSVDMNGYKNYLVTSINNTSSFISVVGAKIVKKDEDGNFEAIDIDVNLGGGVDAPLTVGNYKAGWEFFSNADVEEVSLLMQAGGNSDIGQYIINLADTRKDCVACVSPMEEQVVDVLNPEVLMQQNLLKYGASSYRFYDGNYKYQYDGYNDKYRWVPLNGDMAGLMAQTDAEEYPWYSPAGKTVKDVVKLAFYPKKPVRDVLYANTINPVCAFPEEGTVLWGDWTGVTNSKFSFVGVRRMFIYMERQIGAMARKAMWKQNDEVTEVTFLQAAEPFLRTMQGTRAIEDFKVYAGTSVTSKDEKDQGIFKAKVAVKPIGSIRWVVINFVATRSDVAFDEVIA